MKISVIWTWYVWLIQWIGLAKIWFKINALDISAEKIKELQQDIAPIYENGLDELLKEVKENMNYSTDLSLVKDSDFIFLCVGTPQDEEWKTDLSYIQWAASSIKKFLSWNEIIVLKSTVPVGTNESIYFKLDQKNPVVSNPEFLREGMAIYDFFNPDRIILWFKDWEKQEIIKKTKTLYKYFSDNKKPFVITNRQTAELIKYASNSFLATKISFINELAKLSDQTWANIKDIAIWMWLDNRIWPKFLNSGIWYGWSCFPKDIKSLIWQFKENWLKWEIISATDNVNEHQLTYFFNKIKNKFTNLHCKKIAVIGIAFKPDTDDLRQSKGKRLIKLLMQEGAYINVFDYTPKARENYKRTISSKESTRFEIPVFIKDDIYDCVTDVDGIIITLEETRLNDEDRNKIKKIMKWKIIFDGKNILDKKYLTELWFDYEWIWY